MKFNPLQKNAPSIGILHDIAKRHIFDRQNVKLEENFILEEGIDWYSKNNNITNESDRWEIKRIINALIADEHGYFNRSKLLQAEHRVNYKTMYKAGLPYIDVDNRTTWNKS